MVFQIGNPGMESHFSKCNLVGNGFQFCSLAKFKANGSLKLNLDRGIIRLGFQFREIPKSFQIGLIVAFCHQEEVSGSEDQANKGKLLSRPGSVSSGDAILRSCKEGPTAVL